MHLAFGKSSKLNKYLHSFEGKGTGTGRERAGAEEREGQKRGKKDGMEREWVRTRERGS